jgi:predicted TIM-barrel enzyme
MTSKLERYEIDGNEFWVEVVDVDRTSVRALTEKTGIGLEVETAALQKIDLATTLKAIVSPVRVALAAAGAEEVSVELSIGLKGEVGAFIAKSEGSASLKVTAKWKSK